MTVATGAGVRWSQSARQQRGWDVFKLTADVEGLDSVMELLGELNALIGDYGITGAELKSVARKDGHGETNSQIGDWLAEDGRDFFSATKADTDQIAKTVASVIEQRTQALANRLKRRSRKIAKMNWASALTQKSVGSIKTGWARAAGAAALRAGMREWMYAIDTRMTAQETSTGGAPSKLSERYAAFKAHRFGFVIPIGVASGQLRDNFGASIASGGIRILTRRTAIGDIKARIKRAVRKVKRTIEKI